MNATVALALTSLIATVIYLAIFVDLHVLPTGYNPVTHAVSDYGVGKYAYLFRIGLWDSSLAVLALAFAFIVGHASFPVATKDVVFLLLIPASRVGMSVFPTDLEGRRLTQTGMRHYLFAILAFTFTYLVISETTSVLRDLQPAAWLGDCLKWTAWAVAPELALVVITMLRPLRRVFGLFERLFLITTNVWFVLAALVLISHPR